MEINILSISFSFHFIYSHSVNSIKVYIKPTGIELVQVVSKGNINHAVHCICNHLHIHQHSFISNLSDDRSTASSKTIPPLNAHKIMLSINMNSRTCFSNELQSLGKCQCKEICNISASILYMQS
jgi:hypothetical protein